MAGGNIGLDFLRIKLAALFFEKRAHASPDLFQLFGQRFFEFLRFSEIFRQRFGGFVKFLLLCAGPKRDSGFQLSIFVQPSKISAMISALEPIWLLVVPSQSSQASHDLLAFAVIILGLLKFRPGVEQTLLVPGDLRLEFLCGLGFGRFLSAVVFSLLPRGPCPSFAFGFQIGGCTPALFQPGLLCLLLLDPAQRQLRFAIRFVSGPGGVHDRDGLKRFLNLTLIPLSFLHGELPVMGSIPSSAVLASRDVCSFFS